MKAVLVTGASSGIGRMLAESLGRNGFLVFAGARVPEDLVSLGTLENVHPVRLDVTDQADIRSAVETVSKANCSLYALVNNAGIVTLGPLIDGDDAEFELTLAVNLRGSYLVTRAFGPAIVKEQGRIINIGAVAGTLANVNVGAYSISKHGIEAFTDCLAAEVEPFGVKVSIIEPGSFKSRIGVNACQRKPGLSTLLPDFSSYREPIEVVSAVWHALTSDQPKRRYLVVPDAAAAGRVIRKQILRLMQLNEGHTHTFSRDELVSMLDVSLSATNSASESVVHDGANRRGVT